MADVVHITGMPFLIHQRLHGGDWIFGNTLCATITSLDICNQFTGSAVMTTMCLDMFTVSHFHSVPQDNNTWLCLRKSVVIQEQEVPSDVVNDFFFLITAIIF